MWIEPFQDEVVGRCLSAAQVAGPSQTEHELGQTANGSAQEIHHPSKVAGNQSGLFFISLIRLQGLRCYCIRGMMNRDFSEFPFENLVQILIILNRMVHFDLTIFSPIVFLFLCIACLMDLVENWNSHSSFRSNGQFVFVET